MRSLHLLCLGFAFLTACKKEDDAPAPSGGGGAGATSGSIHIAGYDQPGSYLQACYWIDGVRINLSNGSSDAVANALAVTDDHVYVVGFMDFSGSVLNIPVLWVDGAVQALSTASGPHDAATGVAVYNGEVHVVGRKKNPVSGDDMAMYWHNGAEVALTGSTSDAVALGVFVDASGVYIAGEMDGKAVYWHDGTLVELTDGSSNALATDIAVENGVVHVCGGEENIAGILQACTWANGTQAALSLNGGLASALHVVDGNVYVVGRSSLTVGDDGYSTYWVNGSGSMTAFPSNAIFTSSAGAGIWFDGTNVHTVAAMYGPNNTITGIYANNSVGESTLGFGNGAVDICIH